MSKGNTQAVNTDLVAVQFNDEASNVQLVDDNTYQDDRTEQDIENEIHKVRIAAPIVRTGRVWTIARTILATFGVVYGGLATSPLYTFSSIFPQPPTETEILGVMSACIYSIILIVGVQYSILMLSTTNLGEGGVFALSSLVPDFKWGDTKLEKFKFMIKRIAIYLSIIGAAFMIADIMIGAPISVLSALDGVSKQVPTLNDAIVPVACVILVILFAAQRLGSGKVGIVFGPIMLLWLLVISAIGIYNIVQNPDSLKAFNPAYIFITFRDNGAGSIRVFSDVILCISGIESVYADVGHFGSSYVRTGLIFVMPATVLSLLGQTSALLTNSSIWLLPFYGAIPTPIFWPILILATVVVIVASQSAITSAFSLTQQAIAMHMFPTLTIVHTSRRNEGQTYIPFINVLLLVCTIILTISFRTAGALSHAFSLSVSGVIFISTLLLMVVTATTGTTIWIARMFLVIGLGMLFLPITLYFFGTNLARFTEGAWLTVIIAIFCIFIMVVWKFGYKLLRRTDKGNAEITIEEFYNRNRSLPRADGVGVFFFNSFAGVPRYLIKYTRTVNVLPENMIFVVIKYYKNVPTIDESLRVTSHRINDQMIRVVARYGYFEKKIKIPDVIDRVMKQYNIVASPNAVHGIAEHALSPEPVLEEKVGFWNQIKSFFEVEFGIEDNNTNSLITYFLPRDHVRLNKATWFWRRWWVTVFLFLMRNTNDETQRLRIPPDKVFEVGNVVYL